MFGNPRGKLLDLIEKATERALKAGTLLPIETTLTELEGGYKVLVAKQLAKKPDASNINPFLPPFEDGLYIADLRDHRILLNKFPVSSPHILVVTKEFIPQENGLSEEDFSAADEVLQEMDRGLCFFNAGPLSGFSQPHKHIQIVLMPEDMLLEKLIAENRVTFRHRLHYYTDYRELVTHARSSCPSYNLLWTRKWFMWIPRAAESYDGVALNALGFTGTIYVKNEDLARKVEDIGVEILQRHLAGDCDV